MGQWGTAVLLAPRTTSQVAPIRVLSPPPIMLVRAGGEVGRSRGVGRGRGVRSFHVPEGRVRLGRSLLGRRACWDRDVHAVEECNAFGLHQYAGWWNHTPRPRLHPRPQA